MDQRPEVSEVHPRPLRLVEPPRDRCSCHCLSPGSPSDRSALYIQSGLSEKHIGPLHFFGEGYRFGRCLFKTLLFVL